MKKFFLILQFLTRIPIPVDIEVNPEDFPRGVRYFPLVGLVIGVLDALCFRLCAAGLEEMMAVILTLLFNTLITGALHLDGLADTCDGIFSARSKEKMLEIMKDSRLGTNGAIAIFFDLALKAALLHQLNAVSIIPALIVTPVISRTTMTFLMILSPPARPEGGLGNLFVGKLRPGDLLFASVLCLIIAVSVISVHVIPVIALNLLGFIGYRRLVTAKIQGMTGDTLGAMNEVSEILTLLGLVWWQSIG
ncbi:MAG TPA: adenosylcobinamide-GDP ribazoletransferase [Firmicutes bacterium]|jgi:adenosylcobinamide-GDP ribazoletransferase|nr:adenosylcobinamide-GDP ribazoletransferase [Bacillota bacterium]